MQAGLGVLVPSLKRDSIRRASLIRVVLVGIIIFVGFWTVRWGASLGGGQQSGGKSWKVPDIHRDPSSAKLQKDLGGFAHISMQGLLPDVQRKGQRRKGKQKLPNRQREVFRPGEPWLDDSGALIQAHGGGVIFHEGVYYWFGEQKAGPTYTRISKAYSPPRVDVIGVACYSSTDLLHWHNEGLALKGGSHPDLRRSNVVERPKVLFHRESGNFVMWMHVDTADYEWARVGVAVAKNVTGPYRFLRSFRPHHQQSRDVTVFQDENGSAFIAYSSEDNSVMHVARLKADYLDIQPMFKRILVLLKREAPAIFKYKQYYLLLTSGCTGWAPNRAEVFYSTDMMGDWKPLGNPAAGGDAMDRAFCFFSQPTFVVPVNEKPGRFVFMADQWDTRDLGASRYVWLPMWVEDVPAEALAKDVREWEANKKSHLKAGGSILYTVPPAPIRVVVKWMEAWSPAVIDQELDVVTRLMHTAELHIYPDVGLDPLNLNE